MNGGVMQEPGGEHNPGNSAMTGLLDTNDLSINQSEGHAWGQFAQASLLSCH